MKPSIKLIVCCVGMFCSSLLAQQNEKPVIAVIDNARIFAEFTDKYPAVINYFSKASELDIITFYQNTYGESLKQERKRGRLTLLFANDDNTIRVVISKQNKMQQVDVLVEKKTQQP
jgi:Skp family chaperone for outer membrane proteins